MFLNICVYGGCFERGKQKVDGEGQEQGEKEVLCIHFFKKSIEDLEWFNMNMNMLPTFIKILLPSN